MLISSQGAIRYIAKGSDYDFRFKILTSFVTAISLQNLPSY